MPRTSWAEPRCSPIAALSKVIGPTVATDPTTKRAEVVQSLPMILRLSPMRPMETTMDCCESRMSLATSRRALLLGGASFAAWAYLPKFARAADGRDPRLIVVILRGALDGLATVAPVGDPDYAGLHGGDRADTGRPARGFQAESHSSALHPAMPEFARMYKDKQAAVIHAGVDALSRPLAFRRTGRAGKRLCRTGPGAIRLAQPRAGGLAQRRAGDRGLAVGPPRR